MNYDSILIELLGRVKALEDQMQLLQRQNLYDEPEEKTTTDDIYDYVIRQKERARECGDESIVLRAGEVEKAVGLKNRIVMVVNAMKKAMREGDKIISSPPSGFSTTLTVEYLLNYQSEEGYMQSAEINMRGVENRFILKRAISPKSLTEINELKVRAGSEYIMVFDDRNQCVGVVFEHFEKRGSTANHQAEICFFDEYFVKYGKWHRMFKGGRAGERIWFNDLQRELADKECFEYIGTITARGRRENT